jgi:hypothetical protein
MLYKQQPGLDNSIELHIACLSSQAAIWSRIIRKYVLVLSQHVTAYEARRPWPLMIRTCRVLLMPVFHLWWSMILICKGLKYLVTEDQTGSASLEKTTCLVRQIVYLSDILQFSWPVILAQYEYQKCSNWLQRLLYSYNSTSICIGH